jgi:hypothetical protein
VAVALWPQLPDASLVILDREFAAYALYHQLGDATRQRHWLTRARTGALALRRRVVQRLGPGDALVELRPSAEARRLVRHGPRDLPPTLRVRALRYRRRGFRPQTLLTSLLDPVAYPAAELVALYHERWELELGFDEVKMHTLERAEALRSKTPARSRKKCGASRSATTWCASRWHVSPPARAWCRRVSAIATPSNSSGSSG